MPKLSLHGPCPSGDKLRSFPDDRSRRREDRRSDISGLGATLCEALTGEIPSRGTPLMILEQVMADDPLPPRRLDESIPREPEAICLRCLRKGPHRRYAGAAAPAEGLRRFLAGEPIRPAGRGPRPQAARHRGTPGGPGPLPSAGRA